VGATISLYRLLGHPSSGKNDRKHIKKGEKEISQNNPILASFVMQPVICSPNSAGEDPVPSSFVSSPSRILSFDTAMLTCAPVMQGCLFDLNLSLANLKIPSSDPQNLALRSEDPSSRTRSGSLQVGVTNHSQEAAAKLLSHADPISEVGLAEDDPLAKSTVAVMPSTLLPSDVSSMIASRQLVLNFNQGKRYLLNYETHSRKRINRKTIVVGNNKAGRKGRLRCDACRKRNSKVRTNDLENS
jgi:hypothetical protein